MTVSRQERYNLHDGIFSREQTPRGKGIVTKTSRSDDISATHIGSNGKPKADYIPHHQPFQYYASTANPTHKPPTSTAAIGTTDQANHQYDITRFWQALDSNNLPSVSYLKAPAY